MKKTIISLGFILIACAMPVFATNGQAMAAKEANLYEKLCNSPEASKYPFCNKGNKNLTEIIQIVVKTLFFLVGAVSVVMVIFGGIRYVLSGGDSTAVGKAKNIILYSVIGIVVSSLAYALVNFVLKQFG